MKFYVKRDGIHWVTSHMEGDTLAIINHRFPPYPKQYGRVLAIEPDALTPATVFTAMRGAFRQAIETDRLLRAEHKRGLDLSSISFHYVPAGYDDMPEWMGGSTEYHPHTLIGWKANTR